MPTRMLCAIASVLLVGAVAGCGGGGTDTSGISGSDLSPSTTPRSTLPSWG